MARSKSSNQWLQRHVKDAYVRKARAEGYRSRAAYKLIEVNERHRLLAPGARVVDLGAAPGGWSQVAAQKVAAGGAVVAGDLLGIAPLSRGTVLRGGCPEPEKQAQLGQALGGSRPEVVLAGPSPKFSGHSSPEPARA